MGEIYVIMQKHENIDFISLYLRIGSVLEKMQVIPLCGKYFWIQRCLEFQIRIKNGGGNREIPGQHRMRQAPPTEAPARNNLNDSSKMLENYSKKGFNIFCKQFFLSEISVFIV